MSEPATSPDNPRTLVIDIGGTGLKMIVLGGDGQPVNERARELTPRPSSPKTVMDVLKGMVGDQPEHDRVSVGFPGVVKRGVVQTAPNLGTSHWASFDLGAEIEAMTGKPTRAMNDADLQGYGVIEGVGSELVLTLGTGLGSAVFIDGRLVPNLELAHQRFRKGDTYEQRVSNAALERKGKRNWSERVHRMLEELERIWNYDLLHLGGGNTKKLQGKLPKNVRTFTNVEGMTGGAMLWDDRLDEKGVRREACIDTTASSGE
ncbi:MAG: ROK family protein [Acidobacteriota bacterium]